MKKAVIIGAGPAGLTAAYELLKKTDIRPIVLDQEPAVGGMSRTVDYNGNLIDVGGHLFFSQNEDVLELWKSLLPLQGKPASDDKISCRQVELSSDGPDPEKQDLVLLNRDRVTSIIFGGNVYNYPISIDRSTIKRMGIINSIRIAAGYIRSSISKKDESDLESFLINSYGKPLYEMFFRSYIEKMWGRKPAYISAEYGKQCIYRPSITKEAMHKVTRTLNIKTAQPPLPVETFYYPKEGPGQLWETMRSAIENMGGCIIPSSKVVGINFDQHGSISSVVARHAGKTGKIEADYFISSMPVPELIEAMGSYVSDADIRRIARDLPFRDLISVNLLVKRLDIDNTTDIKTPNDIIPDSLIYVHEKNVSVSKIQVFNNLSPYMVKDPDNTVWLGMEYFCNEGDDFWNMTEKDFISLAEQELEKIGIASVKNILDAVQIKVKKAYPAYFGSYSEFPRLRRFLDGIENLYCVGRNGQHCCNNIDQAMLTAMEAVHVISNGTYNKRHVWSVSDEQ